MRSTGTRRAIVAVIGAQHPSESLFRAAEQLGAGLVDSGFRIATGGLTGVMCGASRGARRAKGWREGSVIGVLPSLDAADANDYVDIAIPTGLNYARNTILVAMAEIVIAVGGGAGTLSEMALAWQHGKVTIALDCGEGWSSKLAGESLDQRRKDTIHRAQTPQEAVALACSLVGVQTERSQF